MQKNKIKSLIEAISCCLELLLLQHCIAVSGHIWAGGFWKKDKAMEKETEDSNCRQADATWRNVIPVKESTEIGKKFQRPEEIMHGRENEEVD